MEVKTFYEMLKYNANNRPDNMAVVYDTISVTYRQLFEDVCKKALHLQRFEGERIAIYGPASYRWIVNMFGTLLAGKDLVVVDFFLPHEVRNQLFKKTKVNYTLTSTNQYILSDAESIMIQNAEKDKVEGKEYDEDTKEGNVIFFSATADECDKPIVLSTQSIISNIDSVSKIISCTPEDRVLSQVPLNHIFGFVLSLLLPLHNGACTCIGRGLRHIDADTYYYRPTILPGTPSMIDWLNKINGFNEEITTVLVGAAKCPFRLFEALNDKDLKVYNTYGMTQVSGCIGINDRMDGSYTLVEPENVKISDEGEILVKGDSVMIGYDNDKDATQQVIVDGYYHTGDYGCINKNGRLVIKSINPGIVLLPTGVTICRDQIIKEVDQLNGVKESFVTFYDNKLISVIVPIDKDESLDKFKRRIDKYNEKKGYRWEIQRIVLNAEDLPRTSSGVIDESKLEDTL